MGLASLKKLLQENYDFEPTAANNNKLNKTLKLLIDEDRNDFGKIGGSYHGGENSPAFIEHYTKWHAQEAQKILQTFRKDEMKCPYCETWNDSLKTWIAEDSTTRIFQCGQCKKRFFIYISDYDKIMTGQTKEYKYSGHRF